MTDVLLWWTKGPYLFQLSKWLQLGSRHSNAVQRMYNVEVFSCLQEQGVLSETCFRGCVYNQQTLKPQWVSTGWPQHMGHSQVWTITPHWSPNYPNSESSPGSRCLFSAGPLCFHLLRVFLFWPLSRRLSVSLLFKVSFTFRFPHPPWPERVSVPVQRAGWLKKVSEVSSISWSITGIVDYMRGGSVLKAGSILLENIGTFSNWKLWGLLCSSQDTAQDRYGSPIWAQVRTLGKTLKRHKQKPQRFKTSRFVFRHCLMPVKMGNREMKVDFRH